MIILKKILEAKTITPKDKGVQVFIGKFLKKIGFEIFTIKKKKVTNSIFSFFYKRNKKIDLVYSGHTDVVSSNNLKKWKYNPFKFILKKKKIFSRGICDMKGSIYCFIKSIFYIIKKKCKKNFLIILTSDEEGSAKYGTKKIVRIIKKKKIKIKNCLIGEPSSNKKLGDIIKNGRRGSCNLKIIINGIEGHSAYPKNSLNSIHCFINSFKIIINKRFKNCDIQITIIKNYNNTINIIPGYISLRLNVRYYKKINLYRILFLILKQLTNFKFFIKIINNNREFFLESKKLVKLSKNIIKKFNKKIKVTNKIGGTSDGRFLKYVSKNLLEIGMVNFYAHKYNENVKFKDIFKLIIIYYEILKKI